jgi:serine phosphatase RsbU (regulator of sigma subunit)
MFGKERVQSLMERHRTAPAAAILERLTAALKQFRGAAGPEDDVTLVVIKLDRTVNPGQVAAG